MSIRPWVVVLLLGCLPGLVPIARAEPAGAIRGRAIDGSGQPLAGARIVLKRAGSGAAPLETLSGADGSFAFQDLPGGGDYVLEVHLEGRATVIVSDLLVHPGQVTVVDVVLQPEALLRERLRVEERADVVTTGAATATTRFSSEFIDVLPLLGRNYQDVLTLAPGVTDVDGDGNPNIHGARDTDVLTLVDGVNTTDPLTGKVGLQMNIEAIQEIEVMTAAASAEFGRAQGGFTSILTKSGGNHVEGALKLYWRGSLLDGDGAGSDPPDLHSGIGDSALRDLNFNDFMGFISVGGPIVRDRAWFYATAESVRKEDPVNALSNVFLTGFRERRFFAKATWQATPANRLTLSLNSDPQEYLNQGLDSFTREETGYSRRLGGTLITLRGASTLSPTVMLETTLAHLDGRPSITPNLGPDTNGNGTLFIDRNGDGFADARERDPGEDYDQDGRFDVQEDPNHNGRTDPGEDLDGDGVITRPFFCEGPQREDIDCDGRLEVVNEDVNHNGILDYGEDLDRDGYLDLGNEDRNGNGILDDTPFPTSLYPYGELKPAAPDREYEMNFLKGITSGPYYQEVADQRRRLTLKQDMTVFVPDYHGSHDLRFGYLLEREQFERDTTEHDLIATNNHDGPFCRFRLCTDDPNLPRQVVHAILPAQRQAHGEALDRAGALYVQDTFRPSSSVTLTLGLRFDREVAYSSGYTPFDPIAEGADYRGLRALAGGERGQNDLVAGDADGIQDLGITADPLGASEGTASPVYAGMVNGLDDAALRRLTGPRTPAAFSSPQLQALLKTTGSSIDPATLAALGLRLQQPEDFAITNNNLSPRLSVAWSPDTDRPTRLFGTWGRYYDKLFLNTVVAEQGPDTIQRYYTWDKFGLDVQRDLNVGRVTVTPNHYIGTTLSRAPATIRQVDRNLRTPYSDELTLGVECEIAPEVALSLRYVRRLYRDQLQDIDINHAVRIDPATGRPADLLGAVVALSNAQNVRVPDGRPDLYINNPFFNEVLQVGNFNEAFYHGLELELRKRMSRRWELLASYTYSRARGAAEDFESSLGNDPSTVESEFGYLDFDQRHVVKVSFTTFMPHDWQAGMRATWSSGLPYSIISRFFALDNADYQQFRTRYGYISTAGGSAVFQTLPRNSERNASALDLNATVRKRFVIGKNVAGLSLEAFNLLNADTLWITSIEPDRLQGFDAASFEVMNTPQQINGTRRFGRRFQVSFELQF